MKFINNYCNFIICVFLFFSSCASEKKIAGYTAADQKSSSQDKIPYGPHIDTPPSPLNLEEIARKTPYPKEVKKLGIEGTVYLELHIGKRGTVKSVDLIESLNPILDSIAIEMVKELKFIPAKRYGKFPIECWLTLPFSFTLE